MNKREFLKNSALLASGIAFLPSCVSNTSPGKRLRTAHIGLGFQGMEDLRDIASHKLVDVVALCDVDAINLAAAHKKYPKAKTFVDYRSLLGEMSNDIDAVIVSTPDHTHAPASIMAMEKNKPVYCQKPLTHHVTEARAMRKMAEEKKLVTQMGI